MKSSSKILAPLFLVLLLASVIFIAFSPLQARIMRHTSSTVTIQQVKDEVKQQIGAITPAKDGYTPIKGVDYTDGVTGPKGDSITGSTGAQGLSAYDIAVKAGFIGTEQDWLDSLHAPAVLPEFRCNPVRLRLEYRLSTTDSWQVYIYNGSIVPCLSL